MANEKRLIDAVRFRETLDRYANAPHITMTHSTLSKVMKMAIDTCIELLDMQRAVDAVEAKKYEALVEMYHELRENFIDYVCDGVRNEAPYCLNKCEYCVDSRGWCKVEKCQGFNPAEVIVDIGAKMDGGNEDG